MKQVPNPIKNLIMKSYAQYDGDGEKNKLKLRNFLAEDCKIVFDGIHMSTEEAVKYAQLKDRRVKDLKFKDLEIIPLNIHQGYYLILSNWILEKENNENLIDHKLEVYKIKDNKIEELYGIIEN